MGEGSSIGSGIIIAIFMIVFFSIWNFVCSNMLASPLVYVYREGCSSASFGRFIPLICPHWLVGIAVPVVLFGVFGIVTMVVPMYALAIRRQLKHTRPADTTSSGAVFSGAVEPVDGVQALDNVCRFTYE